MVQRIDTMSAEMEEQRFYLQYSFPPSSVGETGRVGAPGRREVGHGNLAERALAPVVPPESDFPYSIRVESTITESNGSSSMASVCGGCLSMLDAGAAGGRGAWRGAGAGHEEGEGCSGLLGAAAAGAQRACTCAAQHPLFCIHPPHPHHQISRQRAHFLGGA